MTDQPPIRPGQNLRAAIVQLLSNMSGTKEVRTYLQRFSGVDADRFAVIKIGGAILERQLRRLLFCIRSA